MTRAVEPGLSEMATGEYLKEAAFTVAGQR